MSYHGYEGIALDLDERDRLVHDLGDNRAMILRNHGLLVGGRTIPEAWSDLYYLERACQAQVAAGRRRADPAAGGGVRAHRRAVRPRRARSRIASGPGSRRCGRSRAARRTIAADVGDRPQAGSGAPPAAQLGAATRPASSPRPRGNGGSLAAVARLRPDRAWLACRRRRCRPTTSRCISASRSDLLQTGVYTNGRFGRGRASPAPTPRRSIPRWSPPSPRSIGGWRRPPRACGARRGRTSRPAPTRSAAAAVAGGAVAATLALVWRSTLAIGGARWAGWCALLAAGLGTTEYAVYARTAMTEALSLPLRRAERLLLVLLVRRPARATAVCLGVALGLLTLGPAGVPLPGRRHRRSRAGRRIWDRRLGLAMAAACCWPAPRWRRGRSATSGVRHRGADLRLCRLHPGAAHGVRGDDPARVDGAVAVRAARLRPAAARAAFPDAVGRLGWQDRPDTFYMVGNTTMVQELAANAPNPADQVGYLLRRYVWPHPLQFAAVTLVMAWKSLWVRKYFSLVAVPFLAVMRLAGGPAAGPAAAGVPAAAAVRAGAARRHHRRHAALQPDAGARLCHRLRPGGGALAAAAVGAVRRDDRCCDRGAAHRVPRPKRRRSPRWTG